MKSLNSAATARILLFGLMIFMTSCSKETTIGNGTGLGTNKNTDQTYNEIMSLPKDSLNAGEISSLLFTREEEKLARDVYVFLFNKWQIQIFQNISESEQNHMNAILILLNKYQLNDPASGNPSGVFLDQRLKTLYDQLTTEGSISLLHALKVGALIEDLDIYDIQTAGNHVDNQDIKFVYDNLSKGSRNHLRSFYSNILSNNGTYSPIYISRELFEQIVSSPKEQGY